MARLSKGILAGFSGKVGTVVGAVWKGIEYIRSLPLKSKTTSPAQEVHRAKFALVARFIFSMSELFRLTFKDYTSKMSGSNSALSFAFKNAIKGDYPDLQLDYPNMQVARGTLLNAKAPVAAPAGPGQIGYEWTDNSGIGSAKATDKAILVAYSEELNDCVFTINGAERSKGSDTLDVPGYTGMQVHTWISFLSEKKEIANSIYTGQVLVG